uniref:Flp/Fap pilin component n=1 Tax=Rhodopseudomonas palustris (strain BisA53) TaxID=316055 RepID=Q07K57_RHOP5
MVTVLRTPARPSKVHSLVEHGVIIMKNILARFLKDESGATAIEYGLIAAGIALAIITAVNTVGTDLSTKFGEISTELTKKK